MWFNTFFRSITSKDHPIWFNLTRTISFWLVEGFSTNYGFLWIALSRFLETYSTCLVDILKEEEQRTHLYACEYARKARDDTISQNNDRIWHHLLAMTTGWCKENRWFLWHGCAAFLQPVIFGKLMGSIFELIKMFKKIKKEETSSDETLLSQLMKKFRLSLLGTVLSEMERKTVPQTKD